MTDREYSMLVILTRALKEAPDKSFKQKVADTVSFSGKSEQFVVAVQRLYRQHGLIP